MPTRARSAVVAALQQQRAPASPATRRVRCGCGAARRPSPSAIRRRPRRAAPRSAARCRRPAGYGLQRDRRRRRCPGAARRCRHSSSVTNGISGCSRRSSASSTCSSVWRVLSAAAASLAVERGLGEFDEPVAELVPGEFVQRLREQVEAIRGEVRCGLAPRPAPGARGSSARHRCAAAARPRTPVAFGVHQHEARGVPQLVAEILVALGAARGRT